MSSYAIESLKYILVQALTAVEMCGAIDGSGDSGTEFWEEQFLGHLSEGERAAWIEFSELTRKEQAEWLVMLFQNLTEEEILGAGEMLGIEQTC